MNRSTFLKLVVTFVTLSAAALASGGNPPRYLVTELDALPGGTTKAMALNDFGYTTGESGGYPYGKHAFAGYPDGSIENIETIPGWETSKGYAINNSGQIAGRLTYFPGQSSVSTIFRYTPGVGTVDLGTMGGTHGVIDDINASGHVVGYWANGVGYEDRAFFYNDEDGLLDLGLLGTYSSYAADVNDVDQVVGHAWTVDWDIHAFLWQHGEMQDLGTLGGDWSKAYYINNNGVIVGESKDADGNMQAFRYTEVGGMEQLPMLPGLTRGGAEFVTNSGMVVGWASVGQEMRTFCYTDEAGICEISVDVGNVPWVEPVDANNAGEVLVFAIDDETYEAYSYYYTAEAGPHDINTLLTVELDGRLDEAADINEVGQIIASGGGPTSVILTPVQKGDLNCDGEIDFDDIDPFVLALSAPAAYAAEFPLCADYFADINGDGAVDFDDIDPFVAVLAE